MGRVMTSSSRRNRRRIATALGVSASLAAAVGCSPVRPSIPCVTYDYGGYVQTDAQLAGTGEPSVRLPGVVVTILEGPGQGTSVVTNERGEFVFTNLPANSTIRLEARLAGYETDVTGLENLVHGSAPDGRCTGASSAVGIFFLGQAPHVLWGYIEESGSNGQRRIPAARVEILDGTNAGISTLTDSGGWYRIENLRTSDAFTVECSAAGYTSQRFSILALTKNTQRGLSLSPR